MRPWGSRAPAAARPLASSWEATGVPGHSRSRGCPGTLRQREGVGAGTRHHRAARQQPETQAAPADTTTGNTAAGPCAAPAALRLHTHPGTPSSCTPRGCTGGGSGLPQRAGYGGLSAGHSVGLLIPRVPCAGGTTGTVRAPRGWTGHRLPHRHLWAAGERLEQQLSQGS